MISVREHIKQRLAALIDDYCKACCGEAAWYIGNTISEIEQINHLLHCTVIEYSLCTNHKKQSDISEIANEYYRQTQSQTPPAQPDSKDD